MSEYGTIKIPREDYERHNDRREELNLTWLEYINGEAPDVSNNAEDMPSVEEIRAELDTNAPTYDDVKQACRAAIRDEIPDRALR